MIDIADWITTNMEGARHNSGNEWTALCPYCRRAGKFYVNAESGAWVCFSGKCGERSKRIWKLVAKVEGISEAQARAQSFRDGVSFRRRKATPKSLAQRLAALRGEGLAEVDKQVRAELPGEMIHVYSKKRPKPWRVPKYMKTRGFKRETLRQFGCGYTSSGVWTPKPNSDRNLYIGQRLIIPVISPSGYSWTARDLSPEQNQKPKYLNAPGADHRRLLFGWDQVALESDVAIQEGPTDVMMSTQNGLPTLGLMGKMLNREQLMLLAKKPRDCSFVVMLDPEAMAEAIEIATQIKMIFENVYLGQLPDVDPGEADRKTIWRVYDGAEKFKGRRAAGLSARMSQLGRGR
jgi:DNA primase